MKLNAEKLEVQKSKVKLTISLDVNDFNTTKENIINLLNLAIEIGANPVILKQVFDENGKIKIDNKHTFY
jgi:hypothetical protein